MGLLDSIEKLITEHGSAAILRERIALANDKHAALEKKASTLETENTELKVQVQAGQSENERLRAEIAALKEKSARSGGQSSRLEEVREKILVLLAAQDGIADQQIAQALGIGPHVASFHLQELQSANMVRCTLRVGQRITPWHVSHEGRRYLVSNGLVA